MKKYLQDPNALFQQALEYQKINDILNAKKLCEYILNLYPDHHGAKVVLGNIYINNDSIESGIDLIKSALKEEKNNYYLYSLCGVALMKIGNYKDAEINFLEALKLNKNSPDMYFNLGLVKRALNKIDESISCYNKCLELDKFYINALFNRGNIYLDEFKDFKNAINDYEAFIKLNPDYPFVYVNLANTLNLLGQYKEAILNYEKALSLKPDYAEVYVDLGNTLSLQGRYQEAILNYEKALSLKPDLDYIHGWIANTKLNTSNWLEFKKIEKDIIAGILNRKKTTVPFILCALTDNLKIQKKLTELFVEEQTKKINRPLNLLMKYNHKKIKIGYFSADFHDHATMHLMAEFFELHDRKKFEIIAFSFGKNVRDHWRTRGENAFDHFFDVRHMNDEEVAKLSRSLEIDIAVDLKGYTHENRFLIFFYRAAPIQINYLGYPGTLGAKYMDYIIADKNIIPLELKSFYNEKIIYVPESYQPNCSESDIDTNNITRRECGLPEDCFVYCSFNNPNKITPETFISWTNILKKVNKSVLWILSNSDETNKNLLKEFTKQGLDPERIIFAPKLSRPKHLARLKLADLFLDTFPYNAHTTASDALRVGLPILTMAGESFASRVGLSLLKQFKLLELTSENRQDFEKKGIQLGTDSYIYKNIRNKVETNLKSSNLFNPSVLTSHIELAYEKAYEKHQKGEAAEDIFISS